MRGSDGFELDIYPVKQARPLSGVFAQAGATAVGSDRHFGKGSIDGSSHLIFHFICNIL